MSAEALRPARYFPVKGTPLRMEAGLKPLSTSFGNGPRDSLPFQLDDEREHYLAAKRRVPAGRHRILERGPQDDRVHREVLAWMRSTLRRDHPEAFAAGPLDSYAEIGARIQEDFTVLGRASGPGEAIAVHVSFPSGWRPERIAGASFRGIHGPVPSFADVDAQAESMVRAMIERGPYVRFVWTICADDRLDHHPEEGRREDWRREGPGWLRVERQVTVPFPALDAALFLIRTYRYPFASLTPGERDVLARALAALPDDVRRYKSLEGAPTEAALAQLRDLAERQQTPTT
jgi:dimethylamine monooxygenase subunit A